MKMQDIKQNLHGKVHVYFKGPINRANYESVNTEADIF